MTTSRSAFENRSEEPIAAVHVRIESEHRASIERDVGALQFRGCIALRELRMGCQEAIDDGLVFVAQHAAGCVNQSATGLYQRSRRLEDARLLGGKLVDGFRRLAPLEIGIATQGAEAAARRVDQNAVDLARKTLDLGVALVVEQKRLHVRQAGSREAWLEPGEHSGRDVERIEAPLRAHDRAQQ